ncbi:MAG: NDP-hexose 2,3-dehydratase family protein [Gammaproteobacteria bacterium]
MKELEEYQATLDWIKQQNAEVHVFVKETPLVELTQWSGLSSESGLKHISGNFFSIHGLISMTNGLHHSQPIILQPEYGILGFVSTLVNDRLYLLTQAKIEPGNVNYVQISPTVQATKSNYSQVHKGRVPYYLDYFIGVKKGTIVYDSLQSEQGSRFYAKRNRNMVLYVENYDEVPVLPGFKWVSLETLRELMKLPNIVNMDARTVISGITPNLLCDIKSKHPKCSTRQDTNSTQAARNKTLSRLSQYISFSSYQRDIVPLNQLREWQVTGDKIQHLSGDYFEVIGVQVQIGNREVTQWDQPMIKPAHPGLCACLIRQFEGRQELLLKLQIECGNRDYAEYGPTVQCLDLNYRTQSNKTYPFIEEIINARQSEIVYDAILSEEGGRFYQDQNRYMLVRVNNAIELPSEDYIWVSLDDIYQMIPYGNIFNIQLRSLVSVIPFN